LTYHQITDPVGLRKEQPKARILPMFKLDLSRKVENLIFMLDCDVTS